MRFELKAPYPMSPGQKEAVDKLAANFSKNDKQTLLGITGSGKSVTSDTDALIKRNGIQSKEKIGSIVDTIFGQNKEKIRIINDTEVLDASVVNGSFEAFSFRPQTKKSEWKQIRQFIRHKSPKKLYRIKSSCGRNIVVTGDHNFFVLRDSEFILAKSSDLRKGDFVPLPLSLDGPEKPLKAVNVESLVSSGLKLFASVPFLSKSACSILPKGKAYRVSHYNERVAYDMYRKIAAKDSRCRRGSKFGLFNGDSDLPFDIHMTDSFLRLLGYYIAEGHGEREYFILSSESNEIISDFSKALGELKISFRKRPETCDFSCYSTFYAFLLKSWCGKDSGSKRLPDFWLRLSNKQLANILMAYFSGDGCVEENAITCSTKSEQLSSDLMYSLLRFGIIARARRKMVKIPGKGKRVPYMVISISGKNYLKIFQREIGFSIEGKSKKLATIIKDFENTNVDIIPANHLIKQIRKTLNISQKGLAAMINVRQAYVSLIESNSRIPSRNVTERIVSIFRQIAKKKDNASLSDIDELESLLGLFWSPISKIEKIKGEKYVYDFSVEDNETFLAGNGGLFVHNTFVMANLIERIQKPTLILAHNKTLAAQLYTELKELFPNNRVEYFISFYDYYQPESYIPTTDTYIEKDSSVNDQIEKMRMHAVSSIVSRNDTIIVASISCIYSLGNPNYFRDMAVNLSVGKEIDRKELIRSLVDIQFERNDQALQPGRFRVRGDVIDVIPSYEDDILRVELVGGKVAKIREVDHVTGDSKVSIDSVTIYPVTQYVIPREKQLEMLGQIRKELEERLPQLPPLEAQRLKQRTGYDLEMIEEMGYCSGMENYSRYFDGRKPGQPPFVLIDYFPKDFLMIIDESHQTIPQARAMYNGDHARKQSLVDFGFRLPSALDNRPLKFAEFEKKMGKAMFVSATPAEYELEKSGPAVELITRPTGLLDPVVEMHPAKGQMDHLMKEAKKAIDIGGRALITTITKKMAEDLTDYLVKEGFRVRYLHSDIESLDRIELVRQLRAGEFDILVGINLLREGLDIPEVSTIFILDADKEGFLRDERSLIQTIGRAARNENGRVILYSDVKTDSIERAMEITAFRRKFQEKYNKEHGITPRTIVKSIAQKKREIKGLGHLAKADIERQIAELDAKMREYAEKLEFEKAIEARDALEEMEKALREKK